MKTAQRFRKPYRVKKQKSIFGNRFFWLGILILVFLSSIFYLLFFSEIFQVEKIIITGNKKVSTEDIEFLIEKKLEKKILFFKTKSLFLVNLNEIRDDILNNFPQLAEAEVKRGVPDALYVLVIERLGLAILCQNEQCFLLDSEGVIFEEISEITPKMLKIKKPTLKESLELGEKVIEKDYLEKILEVQKKINEEIKIEAKEFIIPTEERLDVKTTEDWEIYFNLKGDINWQLTKLSLVLKERVPPEKRGNLEYIDLRFERIYIFPETYWQ